MCDTLRCWLQNSTIMSQVCFGLITIENFIIFVNLNDVCGNFIVWKKMKICKWFTAAKVKNTSKDTENSECSVSNHTMFSTAVRQLITSLYLMKVKYDVPPFFSSQMAVTPTETLSGCTEDTYEIWSCTTAQRCRHCSLTMSADDTLHTHTHTHVKIHT